MFRSTRNDVTKASDNTYVVVGEGGCEEDQNEVDDEADNKMNISTLTLSLQCVMSSIKVCRNDMTT